MKHSSLTLAGLLALCLAVPAAFAAEPLPYGHKDPVPEQARYGAEGFVPTSERPVYFRQTFGDYPGATPPLEWWKGTPTQVDGEVKGGKTKLWNFADQKSKNILWKVPVPGWSLSHPIVVGKRVFAVGNPDVVACYVLDSGKVLWQKRISPAFLDGVPEAQAKGVQVAVDLVLALTKGYRCTNPGFALTFGTVYGGVPVLHRREVTWKGRADP